MVSYLLIDDDRIYPIFQHKRKGEKTSITYNYEDSCILDSAWYHNFIEMNKSGLVSNKSVSMINIDNISKEDEGVYEFEVFYCGFSSLYQPSYLVSAISKLKVAGMKLIEFTS